MSRKICAQVWLDKGLCEALDQAARDARDSRAGLLRRIILENVRLSGHFDTAPTPRRYRARRCPEAAA